MWHSITVGIAELGSVGTGRVETLALAMLTLSQLLVAGLLLAIANNWRTSKIAGTRGVLWVVVALAAVGLAQVAVLSARSSNVILLFGTLAALFASFGTLAAFPEFLLAPVSSMLPAILPPRAPDAETERERHRTQIASLETDYAAKLAAVSQRLEPALLKSQIFVSTQDRDLRYVWAINAPPGLDALSMIGNTDDGLMPARAAARLTALKRAAINDGIKQHAEIEYGTGAATRWYDVSTEAMRDPAENITGVTTIAVDVTERKRLEQRLVRLTRDVTHRTKNVLAVVHAIARQTAARSSGEFLESFSNRVRSLARAHDLLVDQDWQGVDLQALINIQLSDMTPLLLARISMRGPQVIVGAEATQNIGLAIHELADNAKKHGALANVGGTISIDWRITGKAGDTDQALHIRWIEKGMLAPDPAIQRTPTSGFGHAFLKTAVGRTLAGCAQLELLPDGLSYGIEIPGYHLHPSGAYTLSSAKECRGSS